MEQDSLRLVRNSFYLGLFGSAVQDAAELMKDNNEQVKQYAEIYYWRALAFLDPPRVIKGIHSNQSTALQAIKQYAIYRSSNNQTEKDAAVNTLNSWNSNELTRSDITTALILAYLYLDRQQYKEALQLVVGDVEHLEKLAVCVMVYLHIERHDLAEKTIKVMTDLDDDDVLTQLCSAWILLSAASFSPAPSGTSANKYIDSNTQSSKTLEAESIIQGLVETFPSSTALLTTQAVAELHKHNYTDAFKLAKSAREIVKDHGVGDTEFAASLMVSEVLLNSLVSVQQMSRPGSEEVIGAIKAEIVKKGGDTEALWLANQKKREEEFDKQSQNYKWTKPTT